MAMKGRRKVSGDFEINVAMGKDHLLISPARNGSFIVEAANDGRDAQGQMRIPEGLVLVVRWPYGQRAIGIGCALCWPFALMCAEPRYW